MTGNAGLSGRELAVEVTERWHDIDDAFVEAHRDGLVDLLVERPGVEPVRARILRLFPRLGLPEARARAVLERVEAVLRAYEEDVQGGDPAAVMVRHPAWVGLSQLELADRLGRDAESALEQALRYASAGFRVAGGAVERGDLLWALAECADDAGWDERACALLERAADGPFAEPEGQHRVAVLLADRVADEEPVRAERLLRPVLEAEQPGLRSQACYLLARLAFRGGDRARASRWLDRAIETAREAGYEDLVPRLEEERSRIGQS